LQDWKYYEGGEIDQASSLDLQNLEKELEYHPFHADGCSGDELTETEITF